MERTRRFQNVYLLGVAMFWFLLNMGINFGPDYWQSSNIGHQGGFITGILIGLTFTEQYDYNAIKANRVPDRFTPE